MCKRGVKGQPPTAIVRDSGNFFGADFTNIVCGRRSAFDLCKNKVKLCKVSRQTDFISCTPCSFFFSFFYISYPILFSPHTVHSYICVPIACGSGRAVRCFKLAAEERNTNLAGSTSNVVQTTTALQEGSANAPLQ